MEIKSQDRGEVRVLQLEGRLSLGGGAAALRERVRSDLDGGYCRLLLDLQGVESLDSTGLGVLVSCLTSARTRGGDLKLLSPNPKVSDVLDITQADRLIAIFDDLERAIDSFQPS